MEGLFVRCTKVGLSALRILEMLTLSVVVYIVVDQLVPRVLIGAPGRSSPAANCTALSNCSTSGYAVVSIRTSPRKIMRDVGNCASGTFGSFNP